MNEYKKNNHQLAISSANYVRIKKIFREFNNSQLVLKSTSKETSFNAEFEYIALSKHTGNMMLRFSNLDTSLLNSLIFEANVYHDVELCEVSRFNGYSPNQFPFEFEKFPKSVDEKSQQNRFFTEVLDMILTNDFYEKT